MQRKKTRQEIVEQVYCNVTDIQKLLGCSWKKAKKAYQMAEEFDEKELVFRIEDHKVRMTSVCKATGVPLSALIKQIKSTQQPGN